jgi:hypothetical protein
MNRRSILATIGGIGAVSTGAVAFTSASVSRNVNVGVSADSTAIIGLTAGSTNAATEQSNGELVIDTSNGSNDLNVEATFTYGDTSDPMNSYLFSLTNNDTTSRDFTLSYTGGSGVVSFEVFDSTGTSEGVVDGSTDLGPLTISSGGTRYFVMTVDTTGISSSATNLGGSLDITVE